MTLAVVFIFPEWIEEWTTFSTSHDHSSIWYSSTFRPLFDGKCNAIVRYMYAAALIAALCFSVSPAAVFWCVVTIIITTIQRKIGWAWSHVAVECFRTFKPRVTHFYPAATIVFIRRVIGINASVFSGPPSLVFFSGYKAWSQACIHFFRCRRSAFTLKTSAALGTTSEQPIYANSDRFSANADAVPVHISVSGNGREPTKLMSSKILVFFVWLATFFITHAVHPPMMKVWSGPSWCSRTVTARSILSQNDPD